MPVATGTSRKHAAPRRSRPRTRFKVFSVRNFALAALVVGVLVILHFSEIEWRNIPTWLERVNRPLALLVMAVLPIFGFPISAVYLAIGAIFGPMWGGLVVAGITLIHVAVTHLLARTLLREHVERWREAWTRRLPVISEGDYISLVAMIVIVPGLPYLARNCLLAVSAVPLRYLLLVGVPVYVVRSYTTLFLGNIGNDPSVKALAIVGAVFATKLAVSALLFKRLRDHAKAVKTAKG
jgi:uncharacterized membrane protein YdjX (TVP38/TMEM64 family)